MDIHSMLEPVRYRFFPQCDRERRANITQFRLKSNPSSLKGLIDLFEEDSLRYIWITDSSFVRISDEMVQLVESDPNNYQSSYAQISLVSSIGGEFIRKIINIFAVDISAATEVLLKCFCEMPDSDFQDMHMWSTVAGVRFVPCPWGADVLAQLASVTHRRLSFYGMEFQPEQSRVLVSEGGRLGLHSCNMVDGGAALLGALEQGTQLSYLDCWISMPFTEEVLSNNFVPQINSICLYKIANIPVSFYRWLGRAQELDLDECYIEGQVIAESIGHENGPRSLHMKNLSVSSAPLSPVGTMQMIFRSLRGNTRLEDFRIGGDHRPTDADMATLVEVLPDIAMLRSFYLVEPWLSFATWKKVLEAVALHPSLTSVTLPAYRLENNEVALSRDVSIHNTRLVASLFTDKKRMDILNFACKGIIDSATWFVEAFDMDTWRAEVDPVVLRNQYRSKFLSLRTVFNRPAVVGTVLSCFAGNVNLAWMLLKMNQDLLASRLDLAHQEVLGKRKRPTATPAY